MRKTYFIWFAVLAFLMFGCRNENFYNQENKTEDVNFKGVDFRIRKASQIPRVTNFIKSKTHRNDLKLILGNNITYRNKNFDIPAELQTDFVVEKINGNITYYIFNVENFGDEKTIYNFEVKEIDGTFESSKIVEYSSNSNVGEDPANFYWTLQEL